jgi:hypothetical protein
MNCRDRSPQRHRGHKGCTEKKLKIRHYPTNSRLDGCPLDPSNN